MKKFIVYLLVIVMVVSLGFAIFYLVRDNEVISISSASVYKDVGDSFTIDVNHAHKKRSTTIAVISSDDSIVSGTYNDKTSQYNATAIDGGVARINVRTSNAKFRNLWCDVIVGDGSVESPYYINSAEQLAAIGMGAEVEGEEGVFYGAEGYEKYRSDMCYKLVSNIDASTVNGGYWVPLRNFSGRFDGNGLTISNVLIDVAGYRDAMGDKADSNFTVGSDAGLFRNIKANGIVYNLKIDNFTAVGTYGLFGTLAGENCGTIERVEIKDANLGVNSAVIGGIVGKNISSENIVVTKFEKVDEETGQVVVNEESGEPEYDEKESFVRSIARIDRCSINMALGLSTTTTTGGETVSDVVGNGIIGGIAGINEGGTVVYSYVKGNVYFADSNSIVYGGVVAKNTTAQGLHIADAYEATTQCAGIKDCYSDLVTNLSAEVKSGSLFGGAIGINQDYSISNSGDIHKVNNYVIGVYYNKDNLNKEQENITKDFVGIASFKVDSNTLDFSDAEAIVYGLTAEEMTDGENFISHVTQDVEFNEDGTSKGIVRKNILWLFDSVWAIDSTKNDGMPYLNYQLIYIPDDFATVGTPTADETVDANDFYYEIEIDYPVSITSGASGKLRILVDESYQLQYSPIGLELTWNTTDNAIVTVDDGGLIKGVSVGVATITATTKTGHTSSIIVIVERVPYVIDKVPEKITMYNGDTYSLSAMTITPAGDYTATFTNENIATYNKSTKVITATMIGTTTLKIQAGDVVAEIEIEVVAKPEQTKTAVLSVTPNQTITGYFESMTKNGIITVTATVEDVAAILDYKFEYVSGSGVVSITQTEDNVFNYTIKAAGKATIRISSITDKRVGSILVYFDIKEQKTITLTLSSTTITGYYDSMAHNGNVTVKNSANASLAYSISSSNSAVVSATISGNVINYTINKVGTATITVSANTADYKGSATIYFTILKTEPVVVNPDTISLNRSSCTIDLYTGSQVTLSATSNNSNIVWSSNNTTVATVSSTGVVTAKKVGTATITATTVNTAGLSASATCVVTVVDTTPAPVNPVIPDPVIYVANSNYTMYVGDTSSIAVSGSNYSGVVFSSSKTSVASVSSSGVITANAVGSAKIYIYAKNINGVKSSTYDAYCNVTVIDSPTTISLSTYNTTINSGNSINITAYVNKPGTVTWTHTGSGATFTTNSNSITVKGTSQGQVTVTASLNGVSATATVVINAVNTYSQYIYTLDQLNAVRYHLDKSYYLAADIYVGDWEPIGTDSQPFTGSLKALANGSTYFKLYNVNCQNKTNASVFGNVKGASFENLIITDSTFIGGAYAGSVAAKANNTTFKNCKAQNCTISATQYAGGICGYLGSSSATNNCTVTGGSVKVTSATGYVGGIVGRLDNSSSKVDTSNTTVELTGSNSGYAGGIVGYINASSSVDNAKSQSSVNASTSNDNVFVGGIAGVCYKTITNSTVASGTITGYNAGGITGMLNVAQTITVTFNDFKSGYRYEDMASHTWTENIKSTAVKESVTVQGKQVGGLVSAIKSGVVSNCYSRAKLVGVSGADIVAGMAATIVADGNFTNAGGSGNVGIVIYSYSACSFSGNGTKYSITSSLVHNYVTSGLSAKSTTKRAVGYVMNYVFKKGSENYYSNSNIGKDLVAAKKTESEMQTSSTYTAKGFSTTYWDLSGYPTLKTER